ncbi:DUF4097 family beta strand repeat-containing protein [Pelagicoccus sp. SDUM812003]|uniref:DUF4097 family beta strand repeat-containing protein n=1 Tax=Pelagicoccus sp. SDUM812003 TaxID=3041267 RepID=UPI00280C64EF|nr:DUF4097 family beta strand repeat-containing protein [Pelagicoccus sp. SDUM812003]MDQ8203386.1 DUF4097 family beta strand repeat-containing protein [Pelagicoccus sp. SDUM812003]
MRLPRFSQLACITLLALGTTALASAKIVRNHQETISLSGIDKVEIHLNSGNIQLVGAEREDLHLDLDQIFKTNSQSEADKLEREVKREIERRGDKLVITIKLDDDDRFLGGLFSGNRGVSFDAQIELPYGIEIESKTNGGNIRAHHLAGECELKTNGGNIELDRILGPLDAHTNGGNIEVSDLRAPARIHTNGGNIRIAAYSSEIEAHTNGGNITAELFEGISGRTELKTNGGSIRASLPSGSVFDLKAKAAGGRVRFDFDGDLRGEFDRNKIDASINGGGPLLSMRTSGGSVTVKNL